MSLRAASSATDVAARAPAAVERRGLRRELIEHPEIVACIEQTAGHSLPHAAEADESDFHVHPQRSWRGLTRATTLTRGFGALQAQAVVRREVTRLLSRGGAVRTAREVAR